MAWWRTPSPSLQPRVRTNVTHATGRLADLLAVQGRVDEAITLLHDWVGAGHTYATGRPGCQRALVHPPDWSRTRHGRGHRPIPAHRVRHRRHLFGLHVFPDGVADATAVRPYRPGPDHVAFGCTDRGGLEKWQRHLDELGIDHGGIVDAPYGSGLSFKDPDRIALEFFAPPAT